MKRTIRLRESELRRMIAESVRRVMNEDINDMQPSTPIYNDILNLGVGVKNAYEEYIRGYADSKSGSAAMRYLFYLCNNYVDDYNEGVNDGTITPTD